jgi:sulfur carrier protein ThiS
VKIRVKTTRSKKIEEIDLKVGSTVESVLKKINVKPDIVVVMRKNIPIPIDDEVKDGEELTILHVSSGG